MPTYDVSTAADLQVTAAVLGDVARAAEDAGVRFLVVGAAARDILVGHVGGIPLGRATMDIDIAVAVRSWADVERLMDGMAAATPTAHRFLVRGTQLDVIPFGAIENADRTVALPDDHELNVLGFREAYDSAVTVRLPGGLTVPVASLPAQSLLKLLAWRDRRFDDRRDAIDLRALLSAYHDGRYLEALYGDEQLLQRHDFDVARAGAERMGREARALLSRDDAPTVAELLASEAFDALVGDMGGMLSVNRSMLSAYRDGFTG
jgi:predicted nucleotidyltransferase